MERLFAALVAHGVRVVRLWLFEDAEGIVTDGAGRALRCDAEFQRNLRQLIGLLQRAGLRAYWVLLDANAPRRRPDMVTRAILTREAAAEAFFQNVLAPLLPEMAPITWGIDLCNEPEAMLAGPLGNGTGLGYDWPEMVPALRRLTGLIRAALPDCALSIGSGFCAEHCLPAGRYAPLALEALDAHFHSPDKALPDAAALWDNGPVILGELGGIFSRTPPPAGRAGWHETQTRLAARLHDAATRGYAAIFLWMTDGLDGHDAENLFHAFEAGPALHAGQNLTARGLLAPVPDTLRSITRNWPKPISPADAGLHR
ncbi:hypothetical protein CKO11_00835 [Rhodobacter sp. TJ_12]|nr:hypothetical protein [Rhodobacter sp. TJ_12]